MSRLKTAAGAPVVDNQNTMSAGPPGPLLLQDVWHLEKLAHFAREAIPERRMHAKGSGAFGVFTVTNDISRHSKARIFSEVGKKTTLAPWAATGALRQHRAIAGRRVAGHAGPAHRPLHSGRPGLRPRRGGRARPSRLA